MKLQTAYTAVIGTSLTAISLAAGDNPRFDIQTPFDGSGGYDAEKYAGACPDYKHYSASPQ